ncbi:NUDIX hydrolase [candidate division WOR-3 bacterium]|nr:NUDIX hydrolase [candidate division WOR-3 bacterium]
MSRRNPLPTVDIIIRVHEGIVLIERKNPPYGWALPGGFIEYGESAEHAAQREAEEETGLMIENVRQFHTYSEPARDPRFHTISLVFTAYAQGIPRAGSDAARIGIFEESTLPDAIVFDHRRILDDYFRQRYQT